MCGGCVQLTLVVGSSLIFTILPRTVCVRVCVCVCVCVCVRVCVHARMNSLPSHVRYGIGLKRKPLGFWGRGGGGSNRDHVALTLPKANSFEHAG